MPIPALTISLSTGTFLTLGVQWTDPTAFVDVSAPPADGRYLTIVQVGDYIRLNRAYPGGMLLSAFDPQVLADLASGRSVLVLDLSNEGPGFWASLFESVHEQLAEHGIARTSVMMLNQNRLMAEAYRQHFGDGGIVFGYFDVFVKYIAGSIDEGLSSSLFDTGEELRAYVPFSGTPTHDFLCMNATPRWHRILTYRHLTTQPFAQAGLLSFHGANPSNPKIQSLEGLVIPPEIVENFGHLVADIDTWMPQEPIRFDTDTRMGNELVNSLQTGAHLDTLYSVVTETDFFDAPIERVTEKAIKAAGLGHPFILVGAPRSVSWLQELGFETFAQTFDHSYDRQSDHVLRMKAIFREIDRQQMLIGRDRVRWIEEVRESSAFNYAHARNGLLRRFAQIVERPLLHRLERFIAIGELR